VLKESGLQWRDICGGLMSPTDAARLRCERQEHQRQVAKDKGADRAARDRCRKLERIASAIAEKLAHTPDGDLAGDVMTRLLHETLTKLRSAEPTR
jgi:hypothetical protein